MNTSHSASGSSLSVGEDSATVTKTLNTADSCTWYANASCKRPRTCYDCLNAQISSGECAIRPNGLCVSLAEYSQFLSKQQEFGIYYKFYPSSQYTYCSADDTDCTTCTATWLADYKMTGAVDKSAFCTGFDGCICLARCALPNWSTSVLADECSSSGTIAADTETSTASRIGFALAIGAAFGVLLGLWAIKLLVRRRGVGRGRGSSVPGVRETCTLPRRPRSGPQLALTGWKELQAKLIALEQETIGGGELAILESQARSENSGATINVPDEGGDYRPMSPGSDVVRRPRDALRLH